MPRDMVWRWTCDLNAGHVAYTDTAIPPDGWLATGTPGIVVCPEEAGKTVRQAVKAVTEASEKVAAEQARRAALEAERDERVLREAADAGDPIARSVLDARAGVDSVRAAAGNPEPRGRSTRGAQRLRG